MSGEYKTVIAIAGNPNSGKTTLFNGLTGSRQRVGNWPGVTVEKKTGSLLLGSVPMFSVEVVDLPGIYSLTSHSEDERIARDYLLSREADLILNIVDASNLERNLFLTLSLIEMRIPLVLVLNMTDLAESKGLKIDPDALSRELDVPVIPIRAIVREDILKLKHRLSGYLKARKVSGLKLEYPEAVETRLEWLEKRFTEVSVDLGANPRWLAVKVLEGDELYSAKVSALGVVTPEELQTLSAEIEREAGDHADSLIAASVFGRISRIVSGCRSTISETSKERGGGATLDKVVLNRFLGIPIFLAIMYVVFWVVINVGGAFIDFFDIAFGALFVDGFGRILERIGSPPWLNALLAGGIGAGIQTVATFIPIIFTMFFMLALLEDSGYMARAAFVMDRTLRVLGLPGKAFIPMIVGFGCTVPAIMATRTLESKRDRYLTMFMVPFMSCGARLPVYALFGAAFFAESAGLVVMSLYLVGILLAMGTGLLLKNILFRGEPSHLVMELPPYHVPRLGSLFIHAWQRLKIFAFRAGKVIVLSVTFLGFLNSISTDGRFMKESSEDSVLSSVGKAITPIFTPMGVEKANWPATVGLFTGLFAKEAVVGTLNGLYGQLGAAAAVEEGAEDKGEEEPWSLGTELSAALASIPENIAGLTDTLLDPLGFSLISKDEEAVAEKVEADKGIFAVMRTYFGEDFHRAYAYLLFILIYAPCVSAMGALFREMGPLFGGVSVAYLTILAWIVSTLYYQILAGGSALWIVVSLVLLGAVAGSFALLRRKYEDQGE